ncbi:AraC family transcriptional regulator [Microbulbifer agarilyticus]|uniref:AraC family transcriptional regulator n=1 Tax=Microbulbifer agarilyticus TaxID=260552 RepID=UPI001C938AEC|nr:AraC family transcriptional regulator [Microbulbifer agarilyticus]MBY6189857.1 AraC family transcriptional regulator [Microbulbifer agarilyticus]
MDDIAEIVPAGLEWIPMSEPSSWPLPSSGLRYLAPKFILDHLSENLLTRECYPTALGYYPSAKGHSMRRASHDDYLLLYCDSGAGQLSAGAFDGGIDRGDVLILPPGLAHQYSADGDAPWTIYWCHFRGALADVFFQHVGLNSETPVLKGIADPALQSSFKSLLSIARTGYGKTAFVHAANQLRQILTLLARLRKRRERVQKNFDYEVVHTYMLDNIDLPLTLETLASVCNLSKYHFARKYKELTGYAPLQHFTHLKVEHACFLLDSSELSIGEISFQLGFEDPLYFSRTFKKVTGLSPTTYRQSAHR